MIQHIGLSPAIAPYVLFSGIELRTWNSETRQYKHASGEGIFRRKLSKFAWITWVEILGQSTSDAPVFTQK